MNFSVISDTEFPNFLPALNLYDFQFYDDDLRTPIMISIVDAFRKVLSDILPNLVNIDLSIESMNKGPCLMPIRNVSKGHLDSGVFQLFAGTEVILIIVTDRMIVVMISVLLIDMTFHNVLFVRFILKLF